MQANICNLGLQVREYARDMQDGAHGNLHGLLRLLGCKPLLHIRVYSLTAVHDYPKLFSQRGWELDSARPIPELFNPDKSKRAENILEPVDEDI